MTPYFEQDGVTLYHGDCREILQGLPDESVSAVVTDPPYGLAFMGKRWDYDVPAVEVWAECLRVLKPGGHLLAFAGTRTQHRMAVRIEDAGFEIRDMIAWVYGSGFPKSLDVSKAIDKRGGNPLAWRAFSDAYAAAVAASQFTHSDIDRTLGVKSSSCYWARTDHRGGMPPRHHWEKVRELLSLPEEFARLYDEAEREVVGVSSGVKAVGKGGHGAAEPGRKKESIEINITAPATPEAKQWQGWGTALKPSWECITVARKPLIGTVAENVLQHGTGAINVDGCRVGTDGATRRSHQEPYGEGGRGDQGGTQNWRTGHAIESLSCGRWPANLIHDGSEEVTGLFPADDDGEKSAARFFYTAKADKSDRGPGNNHPTVKPLDLMRYLVRLVCPIGGVVLDPFSGSGTTLAAAQAEGCLAIGVEREAAYCEIIKGRFHQRRLF